MKVVNIELYRARRAIKSLEERVGQLALSTKTGTVREMKLCFTEWLRANNH